MPDVPLAPDEAAALGAANARLRQVIQAKDTEIAVLREQVEALTAIRQQRSRTRDQDGQAADQGLRVHAVDGRS